MGASTLQVGARVRLAVEDFHQVLEVLSNRGYRLVGPSLDDGQLIYGELTQVADLPVGWTTVQEAGTFRLQPRGDKALFGYGLGQHSWKQFLWPPHHPLWQVQREAGDWRIIPRAEAVPAYACIGVRACELAAMDVQDRVFLRGDYVDPTYRARREQAFILTVNCGPREPGTCFCVSMGTGPRATTGFDLALTEVLQGKEHWFLVEVGTPRGAEIMGRTPHRLAQPEEIDAADRLVATAAAAMGRVLDTGGIKEMFYNNYEHPRWDVVAARCLTCGNCTMVCPTCFCHTLEDAMDLSGVEAERRRRQDVCFTVDFSYLHGGSIRTSPRSRYRQWLTHKLATWIDQFGCSGCVGCGRCITWCPVGIDITEEARAIRETAATPGKE